ncbi:MAG: phosphatidylinositol kinase [Acidobacteriia bacterium]|nr:phosphatidylinositol kinase [Terriglobia bacterium]
MPIAAVQHVRRMRGGAQAQLMRADDGHFYVVKFQNNPQHVRVLANEFLATRLAERIGLPVPATEIIAVDRWLIENTRELTMELAGSVEPCHTGLQFGARYVLDPANGQVFDYLPETMLEKLKNRAAFAGMLALDKWLGNANGRQAVFSKKTQERKYSATFIDQGYCFNAGAWDFPDSALRGVYARNCVYRDVAGWEQFEPWLSRIENFDPALIRDIAGEIPPPWTGDDWQALEGLVETIIARRSKVRELIAAFRDSSRQPFPSWAEEKKKVVQ